MSGRINISINATPRSGPRQMCNASSPLKISASLDGKRRIFHQGEHAILVCRSCPLGETIHTTETAHEWPRGSRIGLRSFGICNSQLIPEPSNSTGHGINDPLEYCQALDIVLGLTLLQPAGIRPTVIPPNCFTEDANLNSRKYLLVPPNCCTV